MKLHSVLFLMILVLFAAACGGGGGSSGGVTAADTSVGLLIGDAPRDDLSAFNVTVAGMRLLRPDGTSTGNLLDAPREVDLLELDGKSALLQVASPAKGVYDGVTVTFQPGSAEAIDLQGQPVRVRMISTSATALFPSPLLLDSGDLQLVHVDVRLLDSLDQDLANPDLIAFSPVIRPSVRTGSPESLEQIEGVVRSVDVAAGKLVVDVRDSDQPSSFGQLCVLVDDDTVFLNDDLCDDRDGDSDSDGDSDDDGDRDEDDDSDSDGDSDRDRDTDRDGDGDGDGDGDHDGDRDGDEDADGDRDADGDGDADTDGDEAAEDLDDFLACVRVGDRIMADGMLNSDGDFEASSIEIMRDDDGHVARIRGTVTSLDRAAARMTMTVEHVDKGKRVVRRVLGRLGNPSEIEAAFGRARFHVQGPRPWSGGPDDLELGQEVRVRFSAFRDEPFPASRIKIKDRNSEFDGVITSTRGLPRSFQMQLRASHPAVRGGGVRPGADITVELNRDTRVYLKLEDEPELDPDDLLEGLRVRVRGRLSGPAVAPDLDAVAVRVRPGELDGEVTRASASSGEFLIALDEVDEPFGEPALADRVPAVFARGAEVEGAARNVNQFFRLFNSLAADESLEIELYGIGDGEGGVVAYLVEVEVDD